MDGKHLTQSVYDVGAEEMGLDGPPRYRTARVQEARKGVCPKHAILDSSLLYMGAGE